MFSNTEELRYPRLYRRVQAVLIDGIVIFVAFFGAAMIIVPLEIHGGWKFGGVAILVFILDPGLVCVTGATIGHHLRGLRVQDFKHGTNLNIFRATVRFFVKALLGLPSLVFILVTKRHQAIHDLIANSVVVIKNPSKTPEHDALSERVIYEEEYLYPSEGFRILAIILYNIAAFICFAILTAILLSENCLSYESCSSMEMLYESLLGTGWFVAVLAIIILGWKCRLWGCKRKKRSRADEFMLKSVQKALSGRGYYDDPIDGRMGEKLRDALLTFQGNEGLRPTGEVDPPTMSRLGLPS